MMKMFKIPDTLTPEFIESITDYNDFVSLVRKMKWGGKGGLFVISNIRNHNLEEYKKKAIFHLKGEVLEEKEEIPDVVTKEYIESIDSHLTLRKLITNKGWGGKKGYFVLKDVKLSNLKECKKKCIDILEKEIKSFECNSELDRALITGEQILKDDIIYIKDKRGILIDTKNKILKIPLNNKKNRIVGYCVVSIEKYDTVKDLSFHIGKYRGKERIICGRSNTLLSKIIVGNIPNGYKIKHKNKNYFDLRTENLISMSNAEYVQSKEKPKGKFTSDYKGVSLINKNCFKSFISFEKEHIHIGHFETARKAAKAYDYYAFYYFGENCGHNNTLTEENIYNLILYGIPDKYLKIAKDLPKNIYRKGDYYAYDFIFNGKRFYKKISKSLDKAIEALRKKKEKLEEEYQKELNKIPLPEITRNSEGIAIIFLHDRMGNITGEVKVSEIIWHELNELSWHLKDDRAAGTVNNKSIEMHVYIYETYIDDLMEPTVDHINRDHRDNRLENLRPASHSLQNHNRDKIEGSIVEGIKGVTVNGNKFVVNPYGVRYSFDFLEEASEKFNELALEKFGKEASLNPPMDLNNKTRILDLFDEEDITIEYIENILHIEHLKQVIKKKKWGGPNGKIKQSNIRSSNFEEMKKLTIEILKEELSS